MNRILIATHSELAEGFAKAVNFFNNDCQKVDYINFYVKDTNVKEVMEERIRAYESDNLIVLTDITYGSVNQVAIELMKTHRFLLVSGINLALVLELTFWQEDVTAEQLKIIVENAKSQIMMVIPTEIVSKDDDNNEEL